MPQRPARDRRSASRLNLGGESSTGSSKTLSVLEEDFVYAAEFGNIPSVQKILEENPSFNVDYSDILGRTPLRLSVGNEHLEVVELLLDRCNSSNLHEALLQAISAGHEQIAETILKHPKYLDVKRENKLIGKADYFYNTSSEDSPFSSDITPLILAAERNQFEIVQLLLLRGETITKPHHYYCGCQECSNKLQFDQLRLAKTRLNAYKGLSSGAYISLSSKDPILTAFELARELRRVATVEKYYKTDYLALADQLSGYVVQLLDKLRAHDELEIVLNKVSRSSEDETYERLFRLKLAIQYNEKKFVAHPSCQQRLVSIWYADLRALERSNWFFRSLIIFMITLCYPLLAVLYWFVPTTKVGDFLRYPCIKFVGNMLSFITFLTMLVISSMAEAPNEHKKLSIYATVHTHYTWFKNETIGNNFPDDFVLRTFDPEIIHLMLTIWIAGLMWQEVKQIYSDGAYRYFDSLYNFLDITMLTLYVASYTMRFMSMMKVRNSLVYFSTLKSWKMLYEQDKDARYYWYWLTADRYFWDSLDPYNVAEALFAIANVISFTRVSYVLPANELFGPMQISLAKMITDIMKFMAIFMVVFMAFMVGLHNLYWYYPKSVRRTLEFLPNNITTEAEAHFGIPDITFRTVFWSWFGRGEPTVVELGDYNNKFTQNVGYWIFGAYNFATVIVLLNMLIAMMTRSFEIIQAEADVEWKFARSKLYMEYINDTATLPVPFNLVPTFKTLAHSCRYMWVRCCSCFKRREPEVRSHPGRIKDMEMYASSRGFEREIVNGDHANKGSIRGIKHFQERISSHSSNGFVQNDSDPSILPETLTYQRVMKRIVKRYIFDIQRENTESTEGDFDELKQDISSFRYEMLNHLNRSQRETKDNARRLDALQDNLANLIVLQNAVLKTVHPNYADDPKLKIKEELEEAQKKRREEEAAAQKDVNDTYQSLRSRRQSRLSSIQEESQRQQSPSISIKRPGPLAQEDIKVEISPDTKDTHITSQRL